jgi:hypothetical protein
VAAAGKGEDAAKLDARERARTDFPGRLPSGQGIGASVSPVTTSSPRSSQRRVPPRWHRGVR